MEKVIYGNLHNEGLEVIEREGQYFVRYDAGSHNSAWREDELSGQEVERLRRSKSDEYSVIIELQRRLVMKGQNPNAQNWTPPAV